MAIPDLARTPMLRIARTWQSQGQINQATDAYLSILQRYPESPEAVEAKGRLLELAAGFEGSGRLHLAMDLYERIERALR